MGRAYIRARRSGRGRWCRFLRGIVPGRDAPGSEPTTPLSAAMQEVPANAPSPCRTYNLTTRVRVVHSSEVLTPHTHAHADERERARALSSWMRRLDGRDVSRVTYGTTGSGAGGHNTEPFITRLRALFRVTRTRRGTMLESVNVSSLRVS